MYKQIYYIALITISFLCANEEEGYGWDIPNSSLNIGGYLDMTYDKERDDKFLFNDIAMLFSANQDHFDILGEVELSHISLDGKSNSRSDVDLNLERLQLNYTFNEKQSIQIGRFNSDIGYWNQAPIPILKDTTSTPHIISNFFPKATTGVLFRQNINEEHTLSFTFQDNNDIAHQDESIHVRRHQGVAYYGTDNDFSWRFSLGSYREKRGKQARYIGIGSEYDGEELSVQAELFRQHTTKNDEKPYSGYIQSTWHFKEKQDAIVRFESYEDNALNLEEQIYLLGYSYRPTSNIALKGEYIYHSELPLNRFVYSFSVLF
jgi:hypothetical protein